MSSELLWTGAAALALVLGGVIAVALGRREHRPDPMHGGPRRETKIERIKRYREQHGVSLKQALDAVEAEDRGAPLPIPQAPAAEPVDIEALVREGRIIEAVKAYRERHGVGLKEAKDAIDRLRRS